MFGSMLGDGLNDILGGHMRQMNQMMNSMLAGGGGAFGPDMFGGRGGPMAGAGMQLMPFGAPGGDLMQMMNFPRFGPNMMMGQQGAGQCYSSSSVMTMSTGPDGKPQVYRESASMVQGPNGVRETKKSVSDSRSGVKKMAIGHYIGERGHVKEKEQNVYSGQAEENEEFLNIEEEEADEFNREFEQKIGRRQHYQQNGMPAIGYHNNYRPHGADPQLALPAPSTPAGTDHYGVDMHQKKKNRRAKPYLKQKDRKYEYTNQ